MIGNITKGRGFRGALNYLLNKEKAELIGGNTIGVTPSELATEFSIAEELNDKVERPVYHASLSLPSGQKLSDEQWNEISVQYLEQMGFTDNQYIVVRHKDTDHDHIHLVASRVRLDGSCVHDSWDYQRSQKAIRDLELRYNLEPVQPSWEVERRPLTKGQYEKRRREIANGIETEPSAKEQIIKAVDKALADCTAVEQLSTQLDEMGVEIRLRRKRDGSINGISYCYQSVSVTGYNLGQGYTWAAISSRMERNHQRQQLESAARIEAERRERVRQQEEEQRRRLESAVRLKVQQEEQQRSPVQQHLDESASKRSEIEAVEEQPTPEEALELKLLVDAYFQSSPPNCSDSELTTAADRQRYCRQKMGQVDRDLEALTLQLEAASFWQRLLPQHSRSVSKLKDLMAQSELADAKKAEADKLYLKLQLVRQRYTEWEQSPSTRQMRQHAKYLLSPQGQELVAARLELEQDQERERMRELELDRQHEHTLYKLQQWYVTAEKLKRTPSYLNWIKEIKNEFTAGTSIPEQATTAMIADLKEWLRHSQSKEIEQQCPSPDWDLSL